MSTDPTRNGETSRPAPGELRVARLPGALSRVVLVIASNPDEQVSVVSLVTNELEFATHADVRVEAEEAGLSFPILVQTDIVAPLWDSQLDPPLGRLQPSLRGLARLAPDLDELGVLRCGLTLEGPSDARWAWKRSELADLQTLASDRVQAFLDREERGAGQDLGVEGFGSVEEPLGPIPVAHRVVADVGLFATEPAVRVRWNGDDAELEAFAQEAFRRLSGHVDIAASVNALAMAEARFAANPTGPWAIDSALAAAEIFTSLEEEPPSRPFDGLRRLLDERLDQTIDVLLRLNSFVHEPRPIEILRAAEQELRDLEDWMSEAQKARFRAWSLEFDVWKGFFEELKDKEPVRTGTRGSWGSLPAPVSPGLVLAGFVDDDARVWFEEGARGIVARLTVSAALSDALTAHQMETAEIARMKLDAVWGSEPVAVWLHLFDRESGDVTGHVELVPEEEPEEEQLGSRNCLVGSIPDGLAIDGERTHGAFVSRRREARIDPDHLVGLVCVAAVAKPAVAGDFARLMSREFADTGAKLRLLRAARAAFGLVEASDEDVSMALEEAADVEAEFAPEVMETVGVALFRYAVSARRRIATEIVTGDPEDFLGMLRELGALLP